MAEKITWKDLHCPMCGAPLKAENTKDPIVCVYCDNTIVPVAETSSKKEANHGFDLAATGGKFKIEGIKTPSSALAYIEQFFEDYDWDSFAYAQNLTIAEIDKLVDSLKMTSADDKNTWLVAFKAVFVPYCKKALSCKNIISDIIEKYKNNDLDAYSKFDAYKRVVSSLSNQNASVAGNLQKFIEKAKKYGATENEIADLNDELDSIKDSLNLTVYSSIEEIPGIRSYIQEKDLEIARSLATKGIYAEAEYARAKALIGSQNYVEALDLLLSLDGYSDSGKLAEKVDEYFIMNNVLEIAGKRYFFKKTSTGDISSLTLFSTEGDKISNKALIKFIDKIVTNYADIIYYIDTEKKLRRYCLSTGKNEKLCKASVSGKNMYVHNRKVYILSQGEAKKQLLELDLPTGKVESVISSINEIILFENNKLVYLGHPLLSSNEASGSKGKTEAVKKSVNVLNVDTKEITVVGKKGVEVEGFIGNSVIYTCKAPTKNNLNLFVKELGNNDSEKLIEKNIFEFLKVFADKLLYNIGNSKNKSLIYANADGSERKEWALKISTLLFEQGGWVYFLRRSGYNSLLCKAHIGDTAFSIVATDVDEFVEIKNGYLYYKNFYSKLIKVRMDGTNLQELCDNVKEVINIKDDSVVFVSVDEKTNTNEFAQSARLINSIYKVDFTGSGKRKLVYNVKNVKEFDDTTVYYSTVEKKTSGESSSTEYTPKIENLYKVDTENGDTEKLLTLEFTEEKKSNAFLYAMIVAAVLFVFGIVCICADIIALTAVLWFFAVISVIIGFLFRSKSGQKSVVDKIKEKVTDLSEEKGKK